MPGVSASLRIDSFVRRLGSSDPAPGGGSAAALAGALGTALVAMVARILLSRPRLTAQTKRRLKLDLKRLDKLSATMLKLVREDAEAYQALVRAQKRSTGIVQAHKRATQAPIDICVASVESLRFIKDIFPLAGPYLGSDLKAARALLKGAFESAYMMAGINLQGPDPGKRHKEMKERLAALQKKVRSL